MPRNPNKRRCQTPGCSAWAMRSLPGSANALPANHCRSHMDHILGPHRAGAPKGNLNALKTGRYALSTTGQALSKENLQLIAHAIAQNPHQVAEILSGHINLIQRLTGDAYLTLLLLTRLSERLLPLIASPSFLGPTIASIWSSRIISRQSHPICAPALKPRSGSMRSPSIQLNGSPSLEE